MKDSFFCPEMRGCVEPNLRMARWLSVLLAKEVDGISSLLYQSLRVEEEDPSLSRCFDDAARESLVQLRLAIRLYLALGGEMRWRFSQRWTGRGCCEADESPAALLAASVESLEALADEYRSLATRCHGGMESAVLECLEEGKRALSAFLQSAGEAN